ncbi:MAG: phosphatase PAP2 family protein [Eubacterium sp.]|nr:phosphatase PAP2 family protein [Eubacterium sp.]
MSEIVNQNQKQNRAEQPGKKQGMIKAWIAEVRSDWAYKGFRFKNILDLRYRHLFLLLFWPFFVFSFFWSEKMALDSGFTIVKCSLDDKIPFCEYLVLPYIIWFPFWILMVLYTCGFEVPVFIKLMKYFMLTLTLALFIFLFWPTGHDMWPKEFPRHNFFTWIVEQIYGTDHPTNVCPSEHVSTAFGVVLAARETKHLSSRKWMIYFWAEAILVCVSVVFIKQHSILDVLAAIPVILIGYFWAFYLPKREERRRRKKETV